MLHCGPHTAHGPVIKKKLLWQKTLSKIKVLTIYFQNAVNEQKRNLNHIHVWWDRPLPSSRSTCTQFEGTWLVGCSKHLRELSTDLPHILLSLQVIPDTLHDVEIRILWGPYHHFSTSGFTLKRVVNDFGSVFGLVVLLRNTFGANKQSFIFLKAFFVYSCLKLLHSTIAESH